MSTQRGSSQHGRWYRNEPRFDDIYLMAVVIYLRAIGADNPKFQGTPALRSKRALAVAVSEEMPMSIDSAKRAATRLEREGTLTWSSKGEPVLNSGAASTTDGAVNSTSGAASTTSGAVRTTSSVPGGAESTSSPASTRGDSSLMEAARTAPNFLSSKQVQTEAPTTSFWKEGRAEAVVSIEAPVPPTPPSNLTPLSKTLPSEITHIPVVNHGMGRKSGVVQMGALNKHKKDCARCHETVYPKQGRMLSGYTEHGTANRVVCFPCAEILRSGESTKGLSTVRKEKTPAQLRLKALSDESLDIAMGNIVMTGEEKTRRLAEIDAESEAIKRGAAA